MCDLEQQAQNPERHVQCPDKETAHTKKTVLHGRHHVKNAEHIGYKKVHDPEKKC